MNSTQPSGSPLRRLIGNPAAKTNILGAVLALAAFCVYLATLAPSIGWEEDGGELAASFAMLGITHPTGYPLFTMLAWGFTHLPLGGREIWKLNLLVAVLCAVAVFLFFRLFVLLLSGKYVALFPVNTSGTAGKSSKSTGSLNQKSGGKGKTSITTLPSPEESIRVSDADARTNLWAAAIAVLCLAFSATFWSEALSIEVYALHLVFFAGVTLSFLGALVVDARTPGKRADRLWLVFALLLGLSFSHHMMTVLCLPAFIYLYFSHYGFTAHAWKKIARGLPVFFAGLAAYVYLPLRSAQGPVMSWGDIDSFSRFWFHVSAGQYRYKMFASLDSAESKFRGFVTGLPAQFGYVPLLLAAVGLWALYRRSRRLLAFSVILLLTSLFFSFNYGFDDPNFYLNAYVAVGLWIAFGVHALITLGSQRRIRLATCTFCLLCVGFPLGLNYRAVDQSGNYAVEEYTRNMLRSLEPGAVVLTSQYIYFSAPAYYLQLVERVRPDVLILDTQLLKFPWYYAQLGRRFPALTAASRPDIDAFLESNARYEREAVLDSAGFVLYNIVSYSNVIRSFLEHNLGDRPVYVTTELTLNPEWGFRKIPSGLVFRIYRGEPPPPRAPLEFEFHPLPSNYAGAEILTGYYAAGYFNQGLFYGLELRDTLAGVTLLRKAVEVRPSFERARQWLSALER